MKTIEEKAKEYVKPYEHFLLGEETKLMEDFYVAGAKDALASQWRSVDDELPKDNREVLVFDEYNVLSICYYNTLYERWIDSSSSFKNSVRYWMPIPDLPK